MDIEGGSLSDKAYAKVRDMVVNRQLTGGDILVESRLAKTLDLTRTPLREALVRLEGAGLLIKKKGRSFAVRQVSVVEFFHSLKVRQYLESKAVALAADRVKQKDIEHYRQRIIDLSKENVHVPAHWILDDDFHIWLAEAGGNNVLADYIRRLRITTQLFEIGRPFNRAGADAEEHLAILKALGEGNTRGAETAIVRHLRNIEKDVLKIVTT